MPRLKFTTPVNDLAFRHGDLLVKFYLYDDGHVEILSVEYIQTYAHQKKADITFLLKTHATMLFNELQEMAVNLVETEKIKEG